MAHFDNVTQKFADLQYMTEGRAKFMRDFIVEKDASDILEVGFFKGKSSAYFAAILEDLGRGHLTTIDRQSAKSLKPNINQVLKELGLTQRATPIFAERSHTWVLGEMVRQTPRPQFDMCYFDGGHTWDVTGFGFILVDMLLKPGGWIIFDDLDWTISKSIERAPKRASGYSEYGEAEKAAPGVRLVFETLCSHLQYTNVSENKRYQWGIAQKPI